MEQNRFVDSDRKLAHTQLGEAPQSPFIYVAIFPPPGYGDGWRHAGMGGAVGGAMRDKDNPPKTFGPKFLPYI